MDMEFTSGRTKTSTKENGLTDSNMEMELTSLRTEIAIRVNIMRENHMALDNTSGAMGTFTLAHLRMD